MQIQSLSLDALAHYPDLLKKYLSEDSSLKSLYPYSPDLKGLTSALEQRKFPLEKRMVLTEHLKNTSYHRHEAQKTAIEHLREEGTFTVTTGHQLNLATGPLYFIYKIISTIRLAEELGKHFSDKKFVPVYWMASEDHDVEEISDFQVLAKTIIGIPLSQDQWAECTLPVRIFGRKFLTFLRG